MLLIEIASTRSHSVIYVSSEPIFRILWELGLPNMLFRTLPLSLILPVGLVFALGCYGVQRD